MTVTLIRGAIHAEVTPRPNGEVFAVEVGHTRIAAHGTSFTVSRQGDQAMVEIDHGAVAVGPVGHPGSTQGWLLVGPDRALFSLDGARDARWLGPPEPASKVAAIGPAKVPGAAIAAPALANHVATNEPNIVSKPVAAVPPLPSATDDKHAAPEAIGADEPHGDATAGILRGLEACYERQVSSLGVRFTIQSSLSLTVLPNGTVREGVFTPPLSPTLMSCAREAISSARFVRGEAIRQVSVPVRLRPAGE
jgi:FecR protein